MFGCINPTNCSTHELDLSTIVLVAILGITFLACWKFGGWFDEKFGGGGRRVKRRPINPYT